MSLGIGIKGPEGIVLAAESRITLQVSHEDKSSHYVNFDNATKLLAFSHPHTYVGVVTYGLGAIGQRSAHSFLPEFESQLTDKRIPIENFTKELSNFYMQQWKQIMPENYQGPPMTFIIGGFNDKESYGRLYKIDLPVNIEPTELYTGNESFGLTWGGQTDIMNRLIQGIDQSLKDFLLKSLKLSEEQIKLLEEKLPAYQLQMPFNTMALQDCVDLAIFCIRTTIEGQKFTIGLRGCGGPIDVAIITRQDGLQYIQKKKIEGELQNNKN